MRYAASAATALTQYLQRGDTLPLAQLRRLGLIYSSYRLIISLFFMLMVYASIGDDESSLLPSLLQQTALGFYVIISLILLGLFYVVTKEPRQQLIFGLALDIVILSLLLYTNGAPDLQLTMLYMVVVAASFMLLNGSQALIITLLAIIFVIYQQFFYAIANSMSLSNLGDALLMSASFLTVGFLSWSISQRLVQVEKLAAQHSDEVQRLNTINHEVIKQMVNGVIVIDQKRIVLANLAAHQLLNIASRFEQQFSQRHPQLFEGCLSVAPGQSRLFIYELPKADNASIVGKLRVQLIPLKDSSQLIILEDLRREQASAQQLKLASLGQLTASIAHEIRNPLATISQASELLMEDVAENEGKENVSFDTSQSVSSNHELYKMIFTQTKRVNRIIEDILKLSRQQTAAQQSIALAEWIPEFIDSYFKEHDVFISIQDAPVIQFDTNQLEQVLINLINNGLRHSSYSHPHAYVKIEIYYINNEMVLDVLDDGAGVNANDTEQLFNPFFTTDTSGTGLGLYLSQAFCEANQARLIYVPEHEKTCFRLIAPAIDKQMMRK